ncbi:hypothetical protein ACFL2K_03280, partial [Candidatus Margulisiibacteriota bacterium]
ALKCLHTGNFQFLHNGLKDKNIYNYKSFQKILAPIAKIYKSLTFQEKKILANAALFHDIYYRVADKYIAEHGPLGAEYLQKNQHLFNGLGLTEKEIETVIALTKGHGYIIDLGRFVFPDEIKLDPKYLNILLLLDFIDSTGKVKNGKHEYNTSEKIITDLLNRFNSLNELKKNPQEFYKFRIKSLFCPGVFFSLPQKEYYNFLAQLENQPDKEKLKDFLNNRLKVNDFVPFIKGFDLLPEKNGLKDYSIYFKLFRSLMKLSKYWKNRYVVLDNNEFRELRDITLKHVADFFKKLQLKDKPALIWVPGTNKVLTKYTNNCKNLAFRLNFN